MDADTGNQVSDGTVAQEALDQSIDDRMDSIMAETFNEPDPNKKKAVEATDVDSGTQEDEEIDPVEAQGAEEEDEQEEPPESALEEVEIDGEVFEVPGKVKTAVLRYSHFVKKDEQVGAREREVTRMEQAVQQKVQLADQYDRIVGDTVGEMRHLDKIIGQINGSTNWQDLRANDPLEFSIRLSDLKGFEQQRKELEQSLHYKKQQFQESLSQAEQNYKAQATEEGAKFLSSKIKSWSPELATKLGNYAVEFGFSKEQASNVLNPLNVMLLYKAYLYDKGKQLAEKRGVPASPTIRPGSTPAKTSVPMRKNQELRARLKRSGTIEDAMALITL